MRTIIIDTESNILAITDDANVISVILDAYGSHGIVNDLVTGENILIGRDDIENHSRMVNAALRDSGML